MGRNLELKIQAENHEEIINILKSKNVELEELLNQRDIYYRRDKGLLKLRLEDNRAHFIKYLRQEGSADRWSNYELLPVDVEKAEKYFEDILDVETIVAKRRELYIYKNTRVHLDTVENLGKFIELETVVNSDLESAKAEFAEVVELLELNIHDEIRASYRDLLMKQSSK